MKRIYFALLIAFVSVTMKSQVPQGFNYQALATDAVGNAIRNTDMQVRISILSDTIVPVIVWEELHSSVRTNAHGIISLVIGTGVRQASSTAVAFNTIGWSSVPLFIRTGIYYQGSWKNMGSSKMWTVPYAMVAGDVSGTVKRLTVAGETGDMEEALFEVKNKNGQTVFAVYNEGVRIHVADGAKGAKGGFAIGGFGDAKAPVQDYFVVKPDSIRMYLDDTPGKASKGGFAIGGFGSAKSPPQNLLIVNADSIRAYIDTNTDKSAKGGFAIGGFGNAKSPGEEYLRVTRDSSRIYIADSNTKGSKGGFSIGGQKLSKGYERDYMRITSDSTNFYVQTLDNDVSSTFNIVGIGPDQTQRSLMKADNDSINISGVLNVQNNFIVNGNIAVGGLITNDTSLIGDTDGNNYKTVSIGTQVWMSENLKATKYNDGTPIPNVTDTKAWEVLATPGYCWLNNDAIGNKTLYGALYNWFTIDGAAKGNKNICPTGWHVPTDDEWTILTDYLTNNGYGYQGSGNDIGKSMASISGWTTVATAGAVGNDQATNNSSGFAALPGGFRYNSGPFSTIGEFGHWWSSTASSATEARVRAMVNNSPTVGRGIDDKRGGFSVRCIKGERLFMPTVTTTAASASVTSSEITSGGNVTDDGGAAVTARGICWSRLQNPVAADSLTRDGSGKGAFSSILYGLMPGTVYYVRAYATNSVGTAYGSQITFTTNQQLSVTDAGGKVYAAITIGTQIWMKENMAYLPYVSTSATGLLITPAYYVCGYQGITVSDAKASANYSTYGVLYNWEAAKAVCPTGWHLPTEAEWTVLGNYLGTSAGGKLKEAGTSHWTTPNTGATNSSGFTALPGAMMDGGGGYTTVGLYGAFWTSTSPGTPDARGLVLDYSLDVLHFQTRVQSDGFSVRCLKD